MLVGLERIRAVRTLLDAFDRAVSAQRVEIIVVEAPTGWGKTALLQAFYQQLAMRQPRPGSCSASVRALWLITALV